MHKGSLIVVSGFSGAGKGTIMKKLVSETEDFALSISMTTRAPREGEQHGKEYYFVTKEVFEETIANDGLVEYACYCGNYYGTPKSYVDEMLSAGKNVLLEIEMQGAMKIKEKFPEAVLLFVMPPSAKVLYERLAGRGTETKEVIDKRMARAVEESQGIEQYDYIVVNDDLDTCVEEVKAIVAASANAAVRNREFIELVRGELSSLVKGEN